jgi:hypothetical protein
MNVVNDIPDKWKNISDLFVAISDVQRTRILLSFGEN